MYLKKKKEKRNISKFVEAQICIHANESLTINENNAWMRGCG